MNVPIQYHNITLWIADVTGFSDAELHLHAGLAILLIARFVSGYSIGTFIPFFFVICAAVSNEILDYLAYGWRAKDVYLDILNTLFWPFTISLSDRLKSNQTSQQDRTGLP